MLSAAGLSDGIDETVVVLILLTFVLAVDDVDDLTGNADFFS